MRSIRRHEGPRIITLFVLRRICMPRGRKRPPQDSVDSILLAISRRDNIDPDTLSHYFDRLDEEWTDGARDKVLHLLRTHDAAAHAAAILILSELATEFDLEELEDLVADPTVSDMAKLTLAPILKEMDSEMADDGLIEYLNDPEAAMQQMQMRLLEMIGQSEMGVESILEDILSMRRPDGLLKGVNVLYQDQWGIKDCYGTDEMDPDRWMELVSDMNDQGFGSFRVPLEFGRALIAEARAVNKRTRRKLPIAYAIWRPLCEGEALPGKYTPTVSTRLESWDLSPEVVQLAQRGDLLYQMPEFVSWMYDPIDRIQPYIDRYWSSRDLFDMSNLVSRSRARQSAQKKQRSELEIETLVSEAIGELVDNKWRALYEDRLLRQGALFQLVDRAEDAKLVRATAAVLHPDSGISAEEQPFVRTMMRLTIEQGPFRALAEALESARLDTMPINLFPED